MAKNKLSAADVTEDPHYHDTWTLLRKYRDVVWSLEVSVRQVRNRFRIDYTPTLCKLLCCGRYTAIQIGDLAHARIVTNSRVLWSVQRIKEYVYKIAC